MFLLLKHVFYVSIKNIKTGSNGHSQNLVSTVFTLHMHIDRVKTGTAKIFAPPLSLSLSPSSSPPTLSLWNTPEALLKLASFVYITFDILQCPPSLQNKKPITFLTISHVKVKVKWSRYRPRVAQRVGRGMALLFHDCGTRRGWVVSSTSRLLFTPGKDPAPILQDAGWDPGLVWMGRKSHPHRDLIPDRPAHSQPLHRLSYKVHLTCMTCYYPMCLLSHMWQLKGANDFTENVLRLSSGLFPSNLTSTWCHKVT